MQKLTRLRHALLAIGPTAVLAGLLASAIGAEPVPPYDTSLTVGDAGAGHALIAEIGCGSCHVIPGVRGADGMVGPPLDHMGRRQIIAGMLRNTSDNMVYWLRFPQKVVPGNAMPDMGLTPEQARDIAAYLYTLQ